MYQNKQYYHCNLKGECLTESGTFDKCSYGKFLLVKSPEDDGFNMAYIVNIKFPSLDIDVDVESDFLVKFYLLYHLGADKSCLRKAKDLFVFILNDKQNANVTTRYDAEKLEKESIWSQHEISFRSITGKLNVI